MEGGGGLGEVKNIRGSEKFGGFALKEFLHPASTYKSLQSAPILEMGEKRVRRTRFLLSWPHLYRANFLENILKRTIFGGRYCEAVRSPGLRGVY